MPLRRLAWAYTRDGQHGDDLFQEIALALWTALPRFRGDSSERTWVYRVAHNTAISHMAGERRRHLREQTVDPSMDSRSYQTALLDRYDRQIVLLKSVRYWYVLPIWSNTIALVAAKAKSPWGLRAGGFAAGMTVFCAGIIWLNEVYAVRRLLVERNRIAETTKHSEE